MNSQEIINAHFEESLQVLQTFMKNKDNYRAIETGAQLIIDAIRGGNKIISCGNGGSMSDAMHFAEELTGRYRGERPSLPAIAISDPSFISCTANDYGYDFIFSRFIEGMGREGDVLLAISTSGNSANVLKAATRAKEMGIKVIGLTGKDGGKLAPLCNCEIRAPFSKYADRVQEIHIKVIHTLIDLTEQGLLH